MNNISYFQVSVFSLLLLSVTVNAQKLPNIQTTSIHSPSNLKIDGNASEWDNKFQAYNKKANTYYTVSNDDKSLYLSIQTTNPGTITKMISGEITFTITSADKTKEPNNFVITFPDYDQHATPLYLNSKDFSIDDIKKNKKQADSVRILVNKKLTSSFKTIAVTGSELIADSIISIYNIEGIKAISLLDDNLRYNYELAVPLKFLEPFMEKNNSFSYNIRLNGSANNAKIEIIPGGRGLYFTGKNGVQYSFPSDPESMDIAYPTDFSGKYILAN